MTESYDADICIAGTGPSAVALGGRLAARGLDVRCIGPDAGNVWFQNYCGWVDEIVPHLAAGADADVWDRIFPKTTLHFDEARATTVDRAYGRFDNAKLAAALAAPGGDRLQLEPGCVERALHTDDATILTLAGGRDLRCRLAIDATGYARALLGRPTTGGDAHQVVYGIRAKVASHPFPLDEMLLMDWRAAFLGETHRPATFCYVIPFGPDEIFAEETSLISRPPVGTRMLADRLDARLASLGIEVRETLAVEAGGYPMNLPLPDFADRCVGFGAAAGYVHPSSGYSLSISLAHAAGVAAAVADAIASGAAGDPLAAAAWAAVWPEERRMRRPMQEQGGEAFVTADAPTIGNFMAGFFAMDNWQEFLSGF